MKVSKGLWISLTAIVLLALFASSTQAVSALHISEDVISPPVPVISDKVDGVGYGPARDGQDPSNGDFSTEEEIREDIQFISTLANSVRTYGITESMEAIPSFCSEFGLNSFPGAWISKDSSQNEKEILTLIRIGTKGINSVKGLVVGNEVMLRQDLSEEELLGYIEQVKDSTGQSVGIAEPWYIWLEHPRLAQVVDVLFVNIYPYWDGIAIDKAEEYVIVKLLVHW